MLLRKQLQTDGTLRSFQRCYTYPVNLDKYTAAQIQSGLCETDDCDHTHSHDQTFKVPAIQQMCSAADCRRAFINENAGDKQPALGMSALHETMQLLLAAVSLQPSDVSFR